MTFLFFLYFFYQGWTETSHLGWVGPGSAQGIIWRGELLDVWHAAGGCANEGVDDRG